MRTFTLTALALAVAIPVAAQQADPDKPAKGGGKLPAGWQARTDKDAALMTRRIAREEGIFAGNSAGSAIAGLLPVPAEPAPAVLVTADDPVVAFELAGRLRSRGIATVTTAGAAPRLTVRVAGNDRYTVEPAEESARLNTFDDLVRLLEDGR